MKANKVLLGSFIVAGLVACQNEEIMEAVQDNDALSFRPQVELELTTPVETRMTTAADDDMQVAYTSNDVLGAVLVDGGYSTSTNNVDWAIVDGHVGNNKWNFTDGKFQTEGTTSVGAWLFYTKYNEEMTTTRGGVKFKFPQIQEGSENFSWVANNNINFFVSPILAIDGYEGEKISLPIKYASVYNNLRMAFDFSAVKATQVQKIVVSATDANGDEVKFPAQYVVKNTNLPIAELSINGKNSPVDCPDHTDGYTDRTKDQELEIERAYKELTYQTVDWTKNIDYKPAVVATGDNTYDYLVVDFDQTHDHNTASQGGMAIAADGKFSAVMLMPAGVYASISFDIYTDKGIYTKEITTRNEYRHNIETNAPAAAGTSAIFLRPNYLTILSDIENKIAPSGTSNKDEVLTAEEYIKVTSDDISENEGVITKTADLINLINGIVKDGSHNVNVIAQAQVGKNNGVDDEAIPAHSVVINKLVMDAIVAKEKALGNKDIQLIFKGAKLKIIGNTDTPLNVHDLTFNDGCIVESGKVNVKSQLSIPAEQTMEISSGVELEFSLTDQKVDDVIVYPINEVVNNGTVKISSDLTITTISNKNSLTIEKQLTNTTFTNNGTVTANTLTNTTFTNNGTVTANTLTNTTFTNKGTVTLNKTWTVGTLTNDADKVITNNGDLTVNTTATNSGSITNLKNITVNGVFNNNETIINGSTENGVALILAKGDGGTLNNAKGAEITNYGSMYCYQGENTINNLGTIYAKEKSTTYITTNSAFAESGAGVVATNAETQVMGVIVLDRRNEDISVTTADRQGYIQYTIPASDIVSGKFDVKSGDKYNKVIVSNSVEFTANAANRINFIVTEGEGAELTLPKNSQFQEVEFLANTNIYSDEFEPATIAHITVKGESTQVKVPTENTLFVYDVDATTSTTTAEIDNAGRIIVGGDLYTSLEQPSKGIFASGHGMATAFHWGETVKPSLLP